jgi:hypothetical protein
LAPAIEDVVFQPRLLDPMPARSADSKFKHDVKNQLGVILGFSELLLADMADDDPRRPDLTEIRDATLTTIKLVDGL